MHPLFSLPGVSIFNVAPDSMHIVDLGFAHHVLGNILFWLVHSRLFPLLGGASAAARLDSLWIRIVDRYPAGTSQLGNLTMSMFCDEDAPHASFPSFTTSVKATVTRHLVPVVTEVFQDLHNADRDEDRDMLQLLKSLTQYYKCLECKEYRLPRRTQQRLETCVWNMVRLYSRMSHWAEAQVPARVMWNEVPKFHYMTHIGFWSRLANPRWSWCYVDEDFMKTMKSIGQACTSGTPSHMVFSKVSRKWGFGVSHRVNRGFGN